MLVQSSSAGCGKAGPGFLVVFDTEALWFAGNLWTCSGGTLRGSRPASPRKRGPDTIGQAPPEVEKDTQ